MTRDIILHRGVRRIPLEHMGKHDPDAVWAMPPLEAPAGRASHGAVLRRLHHTATIGIAVFCIGYFIAQLARLA